MTFSLLVLLCAQSFTIEDVGTLSGNPSHEVLAAGINDRGHVTGENQLGSIARHPFLWDGTTLVDIPPLFPDTAFGGDVNDRDQVVGYTFVDPVTLHAYLWDQGVVHDVHVGDLNYSRAWGIDTDGWTCGAYSVFVPGNPIAEYHAYVRAPDGSFLDLGTFGGDESRATALNDFGTVVGFAREPSGRHAGFVWRPGGPLQDLGTLGGGFCDPWDVDSFDRVVGGSYDANGDQLPFLWENGTMTALPTLGGARGVAKAIADSGDVVGWAQDANGAQRACLWRNGAPMDLNQLIPPGTGWDLTGAHDVNELGEITGTGWLNGLRRAYRLSPVLNRPRITPPTPPRTGRPSAVFGLGFAPGTVVTLAASLQTGLTPVPGCTGLFVALAPPAVVLATVTSDPDGRIEAPLVLPSTLSGATVHLQAVDLGGCVVSDPASRTLR